MKKLLTAVVLAAALLLAACTPANPPGPTAGTPQYDAEAALYVDTAQRGAEISPFLYGQFIEHIDTCIYNGIWSEMVLDRKFYYPVGEGGSPWIPGDGSVGMVTENTYSGRYAARLADASIVQDKISLDAKAYTGYFYARAVSGKPVVTVTARLGEREYVSQAAVTGGEFRKYDYGFTSPETGRAELTFAVTGGEAVLDSLSLMPADNVSGMRRDTLDLLKQLNGTVYRWPGGNFVSGYDFYDGVGDRDRRPSRRNLHYLGLEENEVNDLIGIGNLGFYGAIEPNDFGTDEFLAFCEYIGAQPYIVANSGLGSAEDAANWVEYCNGDAGSEWGAKRAEAGHAEPYGVTYWGVGNEMNGDWQLGHVGIDVYTARHNEFAAAMRGVDPKIKLFAVGDNMSSWSQRMLRDCAGNFDYLSEHFYAEKSGDLAEHVANMRANVEDRIARHRRLPGAGNVPIAFDEYAYDKAESASRLKDGLGVAAALNVMIRNSDAVFMANYSSTVNATQGCVTTTDLAAVMQGAGYVLRLYRESMLSLPVQVSVKSSELDCVAAVSEDGKTITIAVINPGFSSVRLTGKLFENAKAIYTDAVWGEFPDSYNQPDATELYRTGKLAVQYPVAQATSVTIVTVEK